jgi:hypothetical protein
MTKSAKDSGHYRFWQQAVQLLSPPMGAINPGIDCLGADCVLKLLQREPADDLLRAVFHRKTIQDAGFQWAHALNLG